jgi:arginine deiminase
MGHLKKVDWEALAKNLQEALAREMKEVEYLEQAIAALNEQNEVLRMKFSDSYIKPFGSENCAVIRYLENRLIEEIKKNERAELPF